MKPRSQAAWLLLGIHALVSSADSFDSRDARTQDYVVATLADAVGSSQIVVVHRRPDEWFRQAGPMPKGLEHILGLSVFRSVAVLKGTQPLEPYAVVYLYPPPGSAAIRQESPFIQLPSPYRPSVLADDLVRLMLVRPQSIPLPSRTPSAARRTEDQGIVDDCRSLSGEDFLRKYGLQDVFASRVFAVATSCVFRVEHPVPELPPVDMGLNRENFIRSETHLPYLQSISGLIGLTPREVSEIVFTAYWLEGRDGAAKYAAACTANPAILVPLADPKEFTTEVGKRLFEAVKAKPPAKESP